MKLIETYLNRLQRGDELINECSFNECQFLHECNMSECRMLKEAGFDEGKPPGWDQSSVNKFTNTLGKHIGKNPDEKGWFEACVKKMIGPMKTKDRASGFCASLRDQKLKSTMWRGKGKTEKEAAKDVKQNKNVKPLK